VLRINLYASQKSKDMKSKDVRKKVIPVANKNVKELGRDV